MTDDKPMLSQIQLGDILQDHNFAFKRVIEINHSQGVFMACDLPGRTIRAYDLNGKYIPSSNSPELSRGRSIHDISHYRPDYEGVPFGVNHYALYCRDSNRFCINNRWYSSSEMKELQAFIEEFADSAREV